jgi:GNAT superfamily N-acetyltransferase
MAFIIDKTTEEFIETFVRIHMDVKIIELNDEQIEDIENRLEEYDRSHMALKMNGFIHIGALIDNKIVGGIDACMTAFKILYVSTVYIDEAYRRQGIGRLLMTEMEKRAGEIGANMIRLDTFDWQGREFYLNLGYEQVGCYSNETDGFSEYFFLKRL